MSTDQPIVIVSGAGSGIGRQTALQLASQGYRQVLIGRTESKLQQTVELAQRQHGSRVRCRVMAADLADPATAGRAVDLALGEYGGLDAIAHVAGDAPYLSIEQLTPEIYRRCFDVNLSAAVYLASAAWPVMKNKGGVIVNVSSMASVDPFPNFAVYAAAKAGVNMFTRCIAGEGQPLNIRAVTVAPGAVETPMLRGIFDKQAIPESRTLDPAEVADVIVDCITGRRRFDPGEVILLPSPG